MGNQFESRLKRQDPISCSSKGNTMIKEKVKTGVPGLDEMLEGGLIPGRTYVVSGASGTGKTTLAMQFLLEGTRRGERVMYVSLDEPPNEVRQNMRSFGWDIGKVLVFDATPDILSYDKTPVRDVSTERKVEYFADISDEIRKTSERAPVDVSISTLQEVLKQEMKVRRYTRVVIDSLTSLRFFFIKTSEENSSLISFLRVLSDLGITCIVTVQLPEIAKVDLEAHMARGEIRLHKWFDGRGLMRGVTVEKFRGSSHDHRLRPMKIGDDGITIKSMPTETRAAAPEEEKLDAEVSTADAEPEPPQTSDEPVPSPPDSGQPHAASQAAPGGQTDEKKGGGG
jgi:KaiC/GvpD/RAD55 family RecA-like ATPase